MFNSQSYGIWRQLLMQLIPDTCTSRLTNFALLIVGILETKSVYLSVIAGKIPIRAKKLSITKRFERLMSNEAIDVESWYHPWASWLLQSASSDGQLHLVIDTTKISAYCRQIMIGVAYQRRTLPIIWDWVDYPRGHCTAQQQIDLLQHLLQMIPQGIKVSLVGDSEFGTTRVLQWLEEQGWSYAMRQKGRTLFHPVGASDWQRIDSVDLKRGQCLWFGHVLLTQSNQYQTHLVMYWKPGEKEPWYLATHCLSGLPAIRLYNRRMWIEEMFGDMKGHGFNLELSRLRTPERLSRLTLAVCILYVWLVSTGEYVLSHGLNTEVDRTDRQDLSIFRLGWDWINRRLTFDDPIPIHLRPNFCLVSGC